MVLQCRNRVIIICGQKEAPNTRLFTSRINALQLQTRLKIPEWDATVVLPYIQELTTIPPFHAA